MPLIPRIILLSVWLSTLAHAAVAIANDEDKAPDWTYQARTPVNWQQPTITGPLIIHTERTLAGVDPGSGREIWRHDGLQSLSKTGFEEIPGTPLVVFADGQNHTRVVILNVLNGALVFDSRAENVAQILDKQVLKRSGKLLIVGFEVDQPETTLFLYDVATGQRAWKSAALHSGKSQLATLLSTVLKPNREISPSRSHPVELDERAFLIAAGGAIYRINTGDGSVRWRTSFPWGSPQLYLDPRYPDSLFVGAGFGGAEDPEGHQSAFHRLHIKTGEPIWSQPTINRGVFNPNLIFTDLGLVISERTEGTGRMRLLDYETGNSLWGKHGGGLKIKGGVVDYAFADEDLVVTAGYHSAWQDEGKEYLLYVVDLRGGFLKFKKPVKVRGDLQHARAVESGVLYVTTHQADILDAVNGKPRNESKLKGKKGLVTTFTGSALLGFAPDVGYLQRIGFASGRLSSVSNERVTLAGQDQPTTLEVRGDHIVMLGQQHVVAWNKTGRIVTKTYHPAPHRRALLRALLHAQAARSTAASFASGTYAGERFQSSVLSRDFVFMLVRQDNGRDGLAQVNKDTGLIDGVIDLGRDRAPSYQVDDIGGYVFQRVDRNTIAAYQFRSGQTLALNR